MAKYRELKAICGPVILRWKHWVYQLKVSGGAVGYRYRSSKHTDRLLMKSIPRSQHSLQSRLNRTCSPRASISVPVELNRSYCNSYDKRCNDSSKFGGLGVILSRNYHSLSPSPIPMTKALS